MSIHINLSFILKGCEIVHLFHGFADICSAVPIGAHLSCCQFSLLQTMCFNEDLNLRINLFFSIFKCLLTPVFRPLAFKKIKNIS